MNTLDHATRYGIEFRPTKAARWVELGSVGTLDQAHAWLIRFAGSGDYRVRSPRLEVANVRR